MTELHSSSDPILRGIVNALTAAEGVAAAFGNAKQVGALNEEKFEQVNNLHRGELAAEHFSVEWIATLRDLASSLEPAILGETQTWFVHDECDMSDGHEESATTAQGDALIRLRSAIKNLADRLSHVVKLQQAEQLVGRLKK